MLIEQFFYLEDADPSNLNGAWRTLSNNNLKHSLIIRLIYQMQQSQKKTLSR